MSFPILFVGGPWHGQSDQVEKPPLSIIRVVMAPSSRVKIRRTTESPSSA